MAKKGHDPHFAFRALTRPEQRERILATTEKCIDGAPVYLARYIEIYLEDENDF